MTFAAIFPSGISCFGRKVSVFKAQDRFVSSLSYVLLTVKMFLSISQYHFLTGTATQFWNFDFFHVRDTCLNDLWALLILCEIIIGCTLWAAGVLAGMRGAGGGQNEKSEF